MHMKIRGNTFLFSAMVGAAMLSTSPISSAHDEGQFVMKNSMLERPTGYREWVYVGTPVTPNDMNDGKAAFPEFHNVYIHPDSWEHWKTKGEFPDGTIIVKELVSVGGKSAPSGNGYFMGDFIGLEAVLKSKKYFPKEPGNWAFFSFTMPDHESLKSDAKAFPTDACNSCHQSNAATDWIFTQYYPVLRDAKKMGHDGTYGR
ncbi:cytochrome P460 family protein [Pseudomonadota bacterium]